MIAAAIESVKRTCMASGPIDASVFKCWAVDAGSSTLLLNIHKGVGCGGGDCDEHQRGADGLQNADDGATSGRLLRVQCHAKQRVLVVCYHHHHPAGSLMRWMA